jgi:hypothetical protein
MKLSRKPPSSLLGLTFDGNRLEGVLVRRKNGSVVAQKNMAATLTLDPLTNDPELVGREIRNHLEAAGIRERRVAVNVPLNWVLTISTRLPELPEADVESFLQIEAERGFPYGLESLLISSSRYKTAAGEQYATQAAVPKDHILRLEKALNAARLKPVTFAVAIAALQSATGGTGGVLALEVGEKAVALEVLCDGGIAALRLLEETVETEAGQRVLYSDVIARESRITLGQLPASVRDSVRVVRIFGNPKLARQLADDARPRFAGMGLQVEAVQSYSASDLDVQIDSSTAVSSALSLAARTLTSRGAGFGFLPPKVNRWQQFTSRYSSRKLLWAGLSAAAIALLVSALFMFQQWQLSGLRTKWAALSPKVAELDDLQQQIRKFRPWFDESLPSLNILRRLTEAFPTDGTVTAKTLEVRELSNVTCTGTARDNQSVFKVLNKLGSLPEIHDVKLDQLRGNNPLQFTFNFQWGDTQQQ